MSKSLLEKQYGLIRGARQVVLEFLDGLPPSVLRADVPHFGHRTILRTYTHVAASYQYWFDHVVFGRASRDFSVIADEDPEHLAMTEVRAMFATADGLVREFVDRFGEQWETPLSLRVFWTDQPLALAPAFLLTHVETHEFHHKGQILTMARQLGYAQERDRMGGLRFGDQGALQGLDQGR